MKTLETKICFLCKVPFSKEKGSFNDWVERKYCSLECYRKAPKIARTKELKIHHSKLMKERVALGIHNFWKGGRKQKYCPDCSKAITYYRNKCPKCAHPKGENHPMWKGGITETNHAIRTSAQYKEWRQTVFSRDNFTCQWCGKRGSNLNADHIEAFSVLLDKHGVDTVQKALICADLWDISNGRTLCVSCHRKTETFGRPKTLTKTT